MKRTAKVLALAMILGTMAPLSACGGASAQETYQNVKNAMVATAEYNGSVALQSEMNITIDSGSMVQSVAVKQKMTMDTNAHLFGGLAETVEMVTQRTKTETGVDETVEKAEIKQTENVQKIGENYYETENSVQTMSVFQNGVKDETQTRTETELELERISNYETSYAVQVEADESFNLGVSSLFGGLFQFDDAAEVQTKLAAVAAAEQAKLRAEGDQNAVVTVKMSLKDNVYTLKVQQITHQMEGETLVYTQTMTHMEKLVVKDGKISKLEYSIAAMQDFVDAETDDQEMIYAVKAGVSYSFNKKWYNATKITPTQEQLDGETATLCTPRNGKEVVFTDVEGKPQVWMYAAESSIAAILQLYSTQGVETLYFDEACTQPVTANTSVREWNAASVLYTKEAQVTHGFLHRTYVVDTSGWEENYDVLADAPTSSWMKTNSAITNASGEVWYVNGQLYTESTLELTAGQVAYAVIHKSETQPTLSDRFFSLGA